MDQKKKSGRPPGSGEADAQIHLRLPMDKKTAYVKAAQKAAKNLTEWLIEAADEKANG